MKYKISLSKDETHVRIRVFETITGDLAREFAEKAIKKAKQHHIKKFLVDARGRRNIASSFEQYYLGYEDMDQFALEKFSKIACLIDTDDKSHDFVETVFQNAGYDCRLFSDEAHALKWLGE